MVILKKKKKNKKLMVIQMIQIKLLVKEIFGIKMELFIQGSFYLVIKMEEGNQFMQMVNKNKGIGLKEKKMEFLQ